MNHANKKGKKAHNEVTERKLYHLTIAIKGSTKVESNDRYKTLYKNIQ